jgi:hypothetical protein
VPKRVKEAAPSSSSCPSHPHTSIHRSPRLTAPTASTITLTIKSLKPAHTFTLAASPTDAISSLKVALAAQPSAPPADAQRLLLKGKVLTDAKLLQEYSVKDGDTLNLSIKPGVSWDPSTPAMAAPIPPVNTTIPTSPDPSPGSLSPNRGVVDLPLHELPPRPSPPLVALTTPPGDAPPSTGKPKRGHSRIPSVVLSPSPSGVSPIDEKPADILLTFDTSTIPTASEVAGPPNTTYHAVVSEPGFWERLHKFLTYVLMIHIRVRELT